MSLINCRPLQMPCLSFQRFWLKILVMIHRKQLLSFRFGILYISFFFLNGNKISQDTSKFYGLLYFSQHLIFSCLWPAAVNGCFQCSSKLKSYQDVEIHYLNRANDQKHFLLSMRLGPFNSQEKTNFFIQYQNIFQHRDNEMQENYQLVDIV